MAASRAVRTDIEESKMNPSDHHRVVGANGRLKAPSPLLDPTPVEKKVVKEEKKVDPPVSEKKPVEKKVVKEEKKKTLAVKPPPSARFAVIKDKDLKPSEEKDDDVFDVS